MLHRTFVTGRPWLLVGPPQGATLCSRAVACPGSPSDRSFCHGVTRETPEPSATAATTRTAPAGPLRPGPRPSGALNPHRRCRRPGRTVCRAAHCSPPLPAAPKNLLSTSCCPPPPRSCRRPRGMAMADRRPTPREPAPPFSPDATAGVGRGRGENVSAREWVPPPSCLRPE